MCKKCSDEETRRASGKKGGDRKNFNEDISWLSLNAADEDEESKNGYWPLIDGQRRITDIKRS